MFFPRSSLSFRLFNCLLFTALLLVAQVESADGAQDGSGYAGEFWPDNIDGTDCFPKFHRLMADQEKARVVDVMIPAGTAEIPHTHKIDSFMFVDQPTGVIVRNVDQMGNEKVVHQTSGDLLKEGSLPIWQYMEPEPYHYVENQDLQNHYRAIRIEIRNLKGSVSGRAAFFSSVGTKEMIRKGKAVLHQILIGAEPLEIQSKDRTLFLLGRVNTELSVINLAGGDGVLNLAKPPEELSSRPRVWILDEDNHYSLTSQIVGGEYAYLLEVSR